MEIKNIFNFGKKKIPVVFEQPKVYTSKTKRNECKNEDCKRQRENGSSFCKKCSKIIKGKSR